MAFTTPGQECRLRELAEKAGRGDSEAFGALYDETSPVLYGIALRILGDPAAAQDAVAECYERAWKRIGAGEPAQGGVFAWLVLLARSVALERRKPGVLATELDGAGSGTERLQSVLDQLGVGQRRTVEKAFFEGSGTRAEMREAFSRLRSILMRGEGTAQ